MKKISVLLFVLLLATFAAAQDAPKAEVFGGYQYLSLDSGGLGDRQSMHGWNADAAFYVTPNISIVGDVSGAYKTEEFTDIDLGTFKAKLRLHNFLFGPRISASTGNVRPFAHALFGLGRTTLGAEVPGFSDSFSSNGFAMALGGGVDINVNQNFAIRAAKFDYIMNRVSISEFGFEQSDNLNNYRFATGVVFRF